MNKLQRELQRMQQAAKKMEGDHSVPFNELFTKSFMQKHTGFSSIDDLLESGGFHAKTNEEFEAIPENQLDNHIAQTTSFGSWEELFDAAIEQYVTNQLGF